MLRALGIGSFGLGEKGSDILSISDGNENVLAIVPARGGSKGIPRKNLRLLFGEPLIVHTLEAALSSTCISRLIVSTDDPEIADVARGMGVEVPFMRPQALASDTTSQVEVAVHALEFFAHAEKTSFDIVLLLQPTSPLRTADDIDASLEILVSTGADSVISFYQVESGHPYYMYTIEDKKPIPLLTVPTQNTRRQDFPPVYVRNGAIYATRSSVLFQYHNFYGEDVRAYIMPFERSINIDTEVDLLLAQALLQGIIRP